MASDDIFPGYFDWAATTPGDQTILQNALQQTCTSFANPSSVHKEGLQAKALLSDARKRCAAALGVKENNLIFTSGGTESDHWPIVSLLQRPALRNSQSRGNIVISAIEHPAIREMAESMKGLHRSHRCTEVSNEQIGQSVTLMGWVNRRRNLGSLIFVDLNPLPVRKELRVRDRQ